MASRSEYPHIDEDFEIMIEQVRQEIRNRFQELISIAKSRESELLNELEIMAIPYREQRHDQEKKLRQIQDLYTLNRNSIHSNNPDTVESKVLNSLSEAIEDLKKEFITLPLKISTKDKVLQDIGGFGDIVHIPTTLALTSGKPPKYSIYASVTHPVYGFCFQGSGVEELKKPWGVAVDSHTKNIYIADQCNNRVQVFDCNGKHVLSYLVSSGKGQMKWPICLAIHNDNLFISQHGNDCVTVFSLKGSFINQFGKSGKKNGEFNSPRGIAIQDLFGDIFVCDYGNDRVQIFSADFKFKTIFGKFKGPLSIHLSADAIIILDEDSPCVHLYSPDLKLRKRLINLGGGADVQSVRAFCVDAHDNILLTDHTSNAIRIFNQEGGLVHQITEGVLAPVGIAMDTRGRIVLVSQRPNNCLQFF